jgi:hypothetical protein
LYVDEFPIIVRTVPKKAVSKEKQDSSPKVTVHKRLLSNESDEEKPDRPLSEIVKKRSASSTVKLLKVY